MPYRMLTAILAACASVTSTARADTTLPVRPDDAQVVTVVTLGDSITKGVRSGVLPEETFAAISERGLKAKGLNVRVVNLGIGGERTDQALRRLDAVAETKPRVVTIMYGTNDSYVDPGQTASRLNREEYRTNLKAIVAELRKRGIEPILMTEPAWAADAAPNGVGENPNLRLAPFMVACWEVAAECRVPVVDHFAHWTEAQMKGQVLRQWTTDGCHPNPRGHRELSELLLPVLLGSLQSDAPGPLSERQMSGLKKTRQALQDGGRVQVVCFGDSVTGVYYHTGGRRAYTDMLGIALGRAYAGAKITTVNAGISGHTTRDALARIERDVLSHKPTLVTVMFGLNDVTRIPLADYRKNLAEIVAKCRAVGSEVLLCTPNNVISTPARPIDKLVCYCDAVREIGKELDVPVCDVYAELETQRLRDPLSWRLTMSDEIHPNLDGHKRMAESMARAITGRTTALEDVPLLSPALPHVASRLKAGQPIRVLAMAPVDNPAVAALKAELPDAAVNLTTWPTDGKTLPSLEEDAKARVRSSPHDLVVLAIPRAAKADSPESFVHSYAWIMNWSLSFGLTEWDCVVVHPSVTTPDAATGYDDDLIRRLVRAQDLPLIDRRPGDGRPAIDIVREWFHGRPWERID